mgnify:FL=1
MEKHNNLVVKSNRLIQATSNLGLVEVRLMQLAVVDAREIEVGITTDTNLTIHAKRYAEAFGVTLDAAYLALQDAAKTLFERQFTLYEAAKETTKSKRITSRWVSQIAYIDDAAKLEIMLSPAVVSEITRLEAQFTRYYLEQTAKLTSVYSIRLYELLIQWKGALKIPFFELDAIKQQLGVGGDYGRTDNFKRRVLDLAVSQINEHTDIFVNYEQVKVGRIITGFSFVLKSKNKPTDETQKPKKPEQKSKTVKKEEQIDWMTSDILDRFISLSPSQQQAILDQVEPTLKGATQVRFKVARAGSIKQLVTEFSLDINDAIMRSASNGR